MTWNYGGDPQNSELDAIRVLVGDIDEEDPLVSDEEIFFQIGLHGDKFIAASYVCEAIAAKTARYTTMSADGVSVSPGERYQQYMDLAKRLRRMGAVGAAPYMGGQTESDKEKDEGDSDLVQHHFKVGIHDKPGSHSAGGTAQHDDLLSDQ